MKAFLGILTVALTIISLTTAAHADDDATADLYATDSYQFNDYTAQSTSDTNSFTGFEKSADTIQISSQNETAIELSSTTLEVTGTTSNTADLNEQEISDLGVSQTELAERATASKMVEVASNPEADKSFQIKLRKSRK